MSEWAIKCAQMLTTNKTTKTTIQKTKTKKIQIQIEKQQQKRAISFNVILSLKPE